MPGVERSVAPEQDPHGQPFRGDTSSCPGQAGQGGQAEVAVEVLTDVQQNLEDALAVCLFGTRIHAGDQPAAAWAGLLDESCEREKVPPGPGNRGWEDGIAFI